MLPSCQNMSMVHLQRANLLHVCSTSANLGRFTERTNLRYQVQAILLVIAFIQIKWIGPCQAIYFNYILHGIIIKSQVSHALTDHLL